MSEILKVNMDTDDCEEESCNRVNDAMDREPKMNGDDHAQSDDCEEEPDNGLHIAMPTWTLRMPTWTLRMLPDLVEVEMDGDAQFDDYEEEPGNGVNDAGEGEPKMDGDAQPDDCEEEPDNEVNDAGEGESKIELPVFKSPAYLYPVKEAGDVEPEEG